MYVENFSKIPLGATYTFGSLNRVVGRHVAIIDLGTNTFHLLVSKLTENGGYSQHYKKQVHTQLGQEGLENGIHPEAYARGLAALRDFKVLIEQLGIKDVVACGTSALRTASNGQLFRKEGERALGHPIRILSGKEEACIIYKGVERTTTNLEQPVLVMDIGGGSIEFIIGRGSEVLWNASYELGGLRMAKKFHLSNPMEMDMLQNLENHFRAKTTGLQEAIREFNPKVLVGAAGSFETVAKIAYFTLLNKEFPANDLAVNISPAHFNEIASRIQSSTMDDIREIPGMADFRVKLITVSLTMAKEVVRMGGFKKIVYSDYSLKEGLYFDFVSKMS